MKARPTAAVVGAIGILGLGLALVFWPKTASAKEESDDSDDELGPMPETDPDLVPAAEATNGQAIVVADDVTGQVAVTTPEEATQALPTDDLVEDVHAAKELSDEVEAEEKAPAASIDEAVEELTETEEVFPEEEPAPAPVVVQQPAPAPVVEQPAPAPVVAPVAPVEQHGDGSGVALNGPQDAQMLAALLLRAERLPHPQWEEAHKEEVRAYQKSRKLTADGLYGPGTGLLLAGETGVVPIIRKWPKDTWIGTKKYNDYIQAISALGLDPSRERGQALTDTNITEYVIL